MYVGGSGPGNYTTIQSAIDDANDSDTVYVYDDSSPYQENLFVNKSINLIGENRDTTVVFTIATWSAVLISADHVKMSGFSILSRGGMLLTAAIDIRSNFTTINDIYITDNKWAGIGIWGFNNTIKNNIINSNFFYGICLLVCNSNTITGNNISNSMCGIGVFLSNNNKIMDNDISNNGYGIFFNGSGNNIISNNNILEDYNNGIGLMDSDNNDISYNTIEKCECGIDFRYSKSNTITKNNFLKNNRHAYFENCRNKWKNNYWNRPRLLPKLIRGTISIHPSWPFQDIIIRWVNFDLRPALKPYDT